MTFLGFVEGPLWYAAATIFVAGVVWKLVGILRFGRKDDLSVPRGSAAAGAGRAILLHFVPHGGFLKKTAFHFIAGYLFHIGLFVLILFGKPHVTFLHDHVLGFRWTGMPSWGFWAAAAAAIGGLFLIGMHRKMDKVTRLISDGGDRAVYWLTLMVLLTGCLAMGETSSLLRAVHMMFADLWLIYFPFSRMMHAFTFVFTRGYMGATFGRRGVTP